MSDDAYEWAKTKDNYLLTAEEAARVLHISRTVVYRLAARGKLRGLRVGRALRFHPDDVEAYIQRLLREASDK